MKEDMTLREFVHPKFGEVRIAFDNASKKPLFRSSDVSAALGYPYGSNGSPSSISHLTAASEKVQLENGVCAPYYLTVRGLNDVIMKTRKQCAQELGRWLREEVRRHNNGEPPAFDRERYLSIKQAEAMYAKKAEPKLATPPTPQPTPQAVVQPTSKVEQEKPVKSISATLADLECIAICLRDAQKRFLEAVSRDDVDACDRFIEGISELALIVGDAIGLKKIDEIFSKPTVPICKDPFVRINQTEECQTPCFKNPNYSHVPF